MIPSFSIILDLFVSLNERIRILDTGDLFISSTKVQDSGKYTCIRSNEAGSVEMHAYIKVLGIYLLVFLKIITFICFLFYFV